jgi:type II restriction enzyme
LTTELGVRGLEAAVALEQKRLSKPLQDQASILRAWASQAATPADLVNIAEIQPALLMAAGVSDKAIKYMLPQAKGEVIKGIIANYLEPARDDFVEELVYRFLITRSDTLGGAMRNVAAALAQREFSRAIMAALAIRRIPYYWRHSSLKSWAAGTADNADVEIHVNALSWTRHGQSRTMIYNFTPSMVKKNVDLCLLNCKHEDLKASVADPARTALLRIREAFSSHGVAPGSFFVGAAIVKGMAEEIWAQLENGTLTNAANLTNANQVASLCQWLVSL